jgi:N-acetylneuraminate synthase
MKIEIGGRKIGEGEPCYVIAEAGANHNGDIRLAKELAKKAHENGADAVKFQTYTAGKLVTKTAPKYWVDGKPEETQYEVFSRLDKLTPEEWEELAAYCRDLGITFLSTPFDLESVDFLDGLGVAAFKIASADITSIPLITRAAEKGKPVILSTGTSTLAEVHDAVDAIRAAGNEKIAILHCTLTYPTPFRDANLRMMQTLQREFSGIPVGLSDHTIGITVPVAAAALGATIIEKHYTIDKSLPNSPDHPLSVDPPELREMVRQIRIVEEALGSAVKGPVESEKEAMKYARRSIVSAAAIPRGTTITLEMLTFKRPGTGISPKLMGEVVGKKAKRDIKEDEVIAFGMLS